MRCTSCDSPMPEGAAFCIECGASARAVTARTIKLGERPAPVLVEGPQLPAAPQPAARRGHAGRCGAGWQPFARGLSARGGAIMMIGVGLLFLTGSFWPWIMALVGLVNATEELAHGSPRGAAQSLLFFVGLTVLFATGLFWPGILVVIGLAALLDRL